MWHQEGTWLGDGSGTRLPNASQRFWDRALIKAFMLVALPVPHSACFSRWETEGTPVRLEGGAEQTGSAGLVFTAVSRFLSGAFTC